MYKMLIADDEFVEREALTCVVREAFEDKFEIRTADNGKQAVGTAEEFMPDIILMDIKMPVLSGIDAAKKIMEFHPACKIIMLTGFTYFNYAKDCVGLGAFDFIVKPADDELVVDTLCRAMAAVDQIGFRKQAAIKEEKQAVLAKWYQESQLLSDILFCGMEEEQTAQNLNELGITSGFLTAVVLYPSLEYGKLNSARRMEEACRQVFSQIKDEGMKVIMCEHYGRVYMLLISSVSSSRTFYMGFLEEFLRMVTVRQNCTAGIGASMEWAFSMDIAAMFRQAQKAYRKSNAIQFYTGDRNFGLDTGNQREIEQELCACFEKKRFTELLEKLRMVMEQFFLDGNEPRGKICEILVLLNRTASAYVETEPTYHLYSRLNEMREEENIKRYALHYVQGMIDKFILQETDGNEEWAKTVEMYIKSGYMDNINLEDVAKMVGFSTYYFSRMFKQYFQTTFVDYLTSVRIKEAMRLLVRSGRTVKDVCYEVGYSEPNYFARVFKKETGMSPSEYQKNFNMTK